MSQGVPPDGRDAAEELERLLRFLDDFRPSAAEMEEVLRLAAEYYALQVLAPEERPRFLADVVGCDRTREVLEEVRKRRAQQPRFGFGPR
jgi:hypothetical protein